MQPKKCEEALRKRIPELKAIEETHQNCPPLVKVVVEKFIKIVQEKDEEIDRLSKVLEEAIKMTSPGFESDRSMSQD